RIGSMLVEIAESRAFPAAEGVIGERYRDRHVDADHADLNARREIARRIAVTSIDRDAIAIFVVIGKREALFIGFGAHHREHRTEDLFLVDAHVLGYVVEQRAAEEEAVLIALHLEATAVDLEL